MFVSSSLVYKQHRKQNVETFRSYTGRIRQHADRLSRGKTCMSTSVVCCHPPHHQFEISEFCRPPLTDKRALVNRVSRKPAKKCSSKPLRARITHKNRVFREARANCCDQIRSSLKHKFCSFGLSLKSANSQTGPTLHNSSKTTVLVGNQI